MTGVPDASGVLPDLVARSSALDVYGNVKSDLRSYQQAVAVVTADVGVLAARTERLAATQSQVSAAQTQQDAASRALRRFAIDEYVSSGLYSSDTLANPGLVKPFGPLDANGVVSQQYLAVVANDLVTLRQGGGGRRQGCPLATRDASASVTQASLTLASHNAAEQRSATRLVADLATLQTAGACTTVSITAAAAVPRRRRRGRRVCR